MTSRVTQRGEFSSQLFDERSFYTAFVEDLTRCRSEVIIESPFISKSRLQSLLPELQRLIEKQIPVYIMTKDPSLLDYPLAHHSESAIQAFETLGIQVYVTRNEHHRKLAILDRQILWEGSLNILSQTKSREIMRRIESMQHAQEMFDFLQWGTRIRQTGDK